MSVGSRFLLMRHLRLLFILMTVGSSALRAEDNSFLPKSFAGWQVQSGIKHNADPATADQANAPVLKEYGLREFESASYTREDGRKLAIRAIRFADATGAFGAFTFYNQPEMQRESIGDQASSFNQRILFYRGNILVDAVFDRLSAMSAAELRELAGTLPRPTGNANNLPPVLAYVPRKDYIRNTEKYVVGPLGLARIASPLPGNLVDFSTGTEVVLARYQVSGGEATLMVISYPTPQIATEHMKAIDATRSLAQQKPGEASIVNVGPFYDKRSGPLLAIAAGPISQSDARALLGGVNYDADVTWNQNTFFDKRNNLANLLVNIILLCGILMGLALVAGLAFGGIRIAFSRLLPGKLFKGPEEVEFISLHLDSGRSSPPDSKLSSSIKAS